MDYLIFNSLNSLVLEHFWFDTLLIFLAEYLPYILIALLVLFLIKNFRKYCPMVFSAFLAGGLAEIVVLLIRLFFYKERPFLTEQVNTLLNHSLSGSFPSAHSAFFFALSTAVFFYNKKTGLIFYLASLLMVVSRVISGIHWPSDILVGIGLGILCACLVKKFFSKL